MRGTQERPDEEQMMEVRPIKTEADHAAALTRIDALMDAAPDSSEGDELDVLVTLVEAWEAKHIPIPAADPVSAILHAMEAQGYTQSDLARLLNSRSRASEVLLGKRELSKAAMWRLHTEWKVPAESLIAPRERGVA
ncbi:transcriptional regulator [Nisaea sp.]|uniref:helix-turn-helix domain-containing protein n=1 Tax=Nisaea sp. TaxID=2024842 RepID=UPI0032EF1FF6